MTLQHQIRRLALRFGLDVKRYDAVHSPQARLFQQLVTNRVDAVIDVGANDGGYGRFLRDGGFRGPIVSFEPLSSAHRPLVEAAQADEHWHVAPRLALGAAKGQMQINIAGNSTSSSLLPMQDLHALAAPQSRYVGREMVEVTRLDDFAHPAIAVGKRMLFKIDTQGYEMPVLMGADGLWPRIAGVQVELSISPLYEGQALYREVLDFVGQRGFELWNVMPGFVDPKSGRMLQFDAVLFRPDSNRA